MKKILLLTSLFISCLASFAQTTYPGVPLYGTTAGSDRTYRALQLGQATITNTTVSNVSDTITLIPGFVSGAGAVFSKDYFVTVSDTVVMAIRDVSSSYTGSKMRFFFTSANASSLIRFLGYSGLTTSQWALAAGATTILLTQNHYLVIEFTCTGTKWIETYRTQD